jgi:hypothetical protein
MEMLESTRVLPVTPLGIVGGYLCFFLLMSGSLKIALKRPESSHFSMSFYRFESIQYHAILFVLVVVL